MGPFIVDFVCLKEKIIIEVDGRIHEKQLEYDQRRDRWLKFQGYIVLRIKNDKLENNLDGTLLKLRKFLLGRMGF